MPWNRQNRAPSIIPFRDQVVSSMDVAHIMEREIHSESNKAAGGLQWKTQDAQQGQIAPMNVPGFEHKTPPFSGQGDSESSLQEESRSIKWSPSEIGRRVNISGSDPLVSVEAVARDGSLESTTWPTFGRRPRRHSSANSKIHSTPTAPSESQSSLSQAVGFTPSPSYSSPSATPEHSCHCHSFYPYAPYSQGGSSTKPFPSPHTFGMPTPPQSRFSSRSRVGTYGKKTPPPPLPPLDHPVFRERVDEFGVLSTKRLFFPATDKVTRHAQSLPSIARTKKESHSFEKKTSRKRSQSNAGANTYGSVRKSLHSRTSSKTSIASSRRLSAEFSAKQASSLGHNGSWEVDVSKAIISLALKDQVGRTSNGVMPMAGSARDIIPFPGVTCGYNKPSGDKVIGLGSPFFLQNPLPHNLISNPISNDRSKTVKTRYRVREPETDSKARDSDGRIKMLGPVTAITISSTNPATSAKPQQPDSGSAASSSEKTPSRRTGSWLSGQGSRTGLKTPLRQQEEKAEGSSSLLVPQLTVIGPTPEASPISPTTPTRRVHHKSTPTMPPKSILPPVIEKAYSNGSVKRKAEDADVEGDKTPPKEKEQRATFAPDPRTNRLSSHSIGHAPSSFHRSKRVRLTSASEGGRSATSRASHSGTIEGTTSPLSANNTGSWSSRESHGQRSVSHLFSREGPPLARSASHVSQSRASQVAPSRRSLSQVSIPISALVSPHAPSVDNSGTFRMRDPRKPPPLQSTPWTLSFPTQWQRGESRWALQSWVARGGSPRHAWFFFIGFIVFPLWWVAAFLPIPKTRRLGGTDAEKGVLLDDPQVEHDAKSWRFRCRIMAFVSLITYIPFIVLVVVFTHH